MEPVKTNGKSILLLDPDPHITGLLSEPLAGDGYQVCVASSAEEALRMELFRFMLVVAELDLPEMGGFEFIERVREDPSTQDLPIVVCTSRDSESEMVHSLNIGADDYIIKPFSLREAMARFRAVLRRHAVMMARRPSPTRVLEHGGLNMAVDRSTVTIDGLPVMLTKTEFSILALLFGSRNQLFNRNQIFQHVWPGQPDVSARTVDVNISRLRKKLGNYGKNIVNRSGYGYGYME